MGGIGNGYGEGAALKESVQYGRLIAPARRYHIYWMEGRARNMPETTCRQCGTAVAPGRIFCSQCGAALRAPAPLILRGAEHDNGPSKSATGRVVVTAIKYLAGLSAVVFWLCPLRTGTQVLVFVASIAVMLICHFALTSMDEAYANKHAGYWPKPLDWTGSSESDKSSTAETKS
jgi:hypothetical protein